MKIIYIMKYYKKETIKATSQISNTKEWTYWRHIIAKLITIDDDDHDDDDNQ